MSSISVSMPGSPKVRRRRVGRMGEELAAGTGAVVDDLIVAPAGRDRVTPRRPGVMAKYVRVEMIELPVEQLSDSAGVPVEHFRAARQCWAVGREACAAIAR